MAEIRDRDARAATLAAAYPRGADDVALAGLLKAALYPYQAQGALFAARAGRVLIGDEMGLGKTIQAIAVVELFARHFAVERVLVVCPTSLKRQWQREFEKFSERQASVVRGLRTAREQHFREPHFCKITNYETLLRDLDLIKAWRPDVVVLDEAQRIKNWNTRAAQAVKRIDSPYAIVLTGTPLENRLEELISIVQFVDKHRLGPTWRLLEEHQIRDDDGRVIGYRDLARIGKTLAPVLLRRRRSEVAKQLPARVDNNFFVPMTDLQRHHHEENGEIVARIADRWRRQGFLSDADQLRLTCALQNMRMVCDSTYLLDDKTDQGHKVDELEMLLEDVLDGTDSKVVIFSQWLRMHELIELRLKVKGWGYALFHGGVPGDRRGELVQRFHDDPQCRVFLATDAGGVGLNLQHASAMVINMDLPWNPAVLEQRIGRVHRLGQERGVQVVNFVAQGSIEESMLSVLAFKTSLFKGILDDGDREIHLSGSRLAQFMKTVEEVTGAIREGDTSESSGRLEPGDPVDPAPEAPQPMEDQQNPWAPLIEIGMRAIQALADPDKLQGSQPAWMETDRATGKRYLRLPVPEPAAVQKLAQALGEFLQGIRR